MINWGDFQECGGILTWTGEDDITFIDDVELQEKLSDFIIATVGNNKLTSCIERLVRMQSNCKMQWLIWIISFQTCQWPWIVLSFYLRTTHQKKTLTLRLIISPKQLM